MSILRRRIEEWSACSGRSGYEVRVRFCFSLTQRRTVPPATTAAATRSVSDSVFRCRKEERFRLQRSWRLRGPRPILFFVAAKKNGSACRTPLPHGCSDSGFQGSNLGIAARKPSRTAKLLHRFLISRPNLRIDASFSPFPPSCLHRFLISGPDMRIDARKPSETALFVH